MAIRAHIPNIIPANVRVALMIVSVCLLVYMSAGVATGYTYLPGKRGGFLLSGLPTLLIVVSACGLFLASLLMIVDHYDRRPNEASYSLLRKYCLKGALYTFIAAPFVEIAQRLLLIWDIDVFPHFRGLAENYTFYNPKLHSLMQYVEPITSNALLIGLLSVLTGGLGLLIQKRSSGLKRLVAILVSISMLSLSVLWLAGSTQDFLSGEVKAGRRYHKYIVRADQEPGKFNAILLTHFALGGFMLTASAFVLVGALTDRLKSHGRPTRGSQSHQSSGRHSKRRVPYVRRR